MKKFKVAWYIGSVEMVDSILEEKIVESESIYSIDVNTILPKEICNKVYYVRKILFSETLITIDYGSYSKFVLIEELKEGENTDGNLSNNLPRRIQ